MSLWRTRPQTEPTWHTTDLATVAGDPRAMEQLMTTIRPLVVRYCRARLSPRARAWTSADDVAQDVCLAVLKALPTYRDEGRPFLSFVYRVARNKVADAGKAAARNRAEPVAEVPDEFDGGADPEQRALQRELNERTSELLRVLPRRRREILVLRVAVGLTAEETAAVLGTTPGSVRVTQHRALARLRQEVVTANKASAMSPRPVRRPSMSTVPVS
jgi:RNA polymerase sigma-70 factor (ECF subfamily)